jgi:hypothetical protein
MAKSGTPIRLRADLMEAAALEGKVLHRSTAQQIEYWAHLGRAVGTSLPTQDLLDLAEGRAKLRVQKVQQS